jgi:hypothetical protein
MHGRGPGVRQCHDHDDDDEEEEEEEDDDDDGDDMLKLILRLRLTTMLVMKLKFRFRSFSIPPIQNFGNCQQGALHMPGTMFCPPFSGIFSPAIL